MQTQFYIRIIGFLVMVLVVVDCSSLAKPSEKNELEQTLREKRSSGNKLNHKVSNAVTVLLKKFESFPKICHDQAINVPYKSPLRKMMLRIGNCKNFKKSYHQFLTNLTENVGQVIIDGGLLDQLTVCFMAPGRKNLCTISQMRHHFNKLLMELLLVNSNSKGSENASLDYLLGLKLPFSSWFCSPRKQKDIGKSLNGAEQDVYACHIMNDIRSILLRIKAFINNYSE